MTDDPFSIILQEDETYFEVDLAAERKNGSPNTEKIIAIEIKSFAGASMIHAFHEALGQFLNYRLVLEEIEPDRILYLAIPIAAYQSFFQRELPKASVKRHQVKIIVYDLVKEEISKWIN